ncbi:MAG TPA: hypothetical protein VF867_19950 [Arthrobacter sp.]
MTDPATPATIAGGPTLAQLILARKDGRSYEQMSADCGGQPAGRRLQQLTMPSIVMRAFPDPATITAVATGLGVSVVEVVLASARSLGLPVDGARADMINIPGAGSLPEDSRQAVIDVARALVSAHS